MSQPAVTLQRNGNIATLAFNRPEKRNAINQAMWELIADLIDEVSTDSSIRVLMVTGKGGAFSAGADIGEFKAIARDAKRLAANNDAIQIAQQKLEELARPTLAVIDGPCIGGGCGLALSCDLRIASSRSVLGITPAKLGLMYSLRDTRRLLALVGPSVAKEILYLGAKIDASEALAKGLINQLVDAEQLAAKALLLAEQLAASSQYSIRSTKRVIATLEGYGDVSDQEARQLFEDAFTGEDCQEGVDAFFDKRAPKFTWA